MTHLRENCHTLLMPTKRTRHLITETDQVARAQRLADAHTALQRLAIHTVALTDDSPARLASLRATTRLRLPDCCILLAAQDAGTGVTIFTCDEQLAATAVSLGLDVRTSSS